MKNPTWFQCERNSQSRQYCGKCGDEPAIAETWQQRRGNDDKRRIIQELTERGGLVATVLWLQSFL